MTIETNGVLDEKQRETMLDSIKRDIEIGKKTMAFLETTQISGMRSLDMLNCLSWVKHVVAMMEDQYRKLQPK